MKKAPNIGQFPRPDSLYYHVARDALEAAKIKNIENQDDKFYCREQIVTSMVFSALCLETFINLEYDSHEETTEIKDADRIPLETKWFILPLLLGAKKTFKRNEPPYQTFKELITTRNNRLVHFKPQKESKSKKGYHQNKSKGYFIDLVDSLELAEKFFECVGLMIKELNTLTNQQTEIPEFIKGVKYSEKLVGMASF